MFAAVLAIGVGCSKDDVLNTDTTDMYGVYTGAGGEPGTITLHGTQYSLPAHSLGSSGSGFSLEGTLAIAGQAPIAVSGFYDTGSGSVAFEDAAFLYSFVGQAAAVTVTGVVNGGAGGTFALFLNGSTANVTVFCGTGFCTSGCSGGVSINLAVAGTTAVMSANLQGAPGFGGGTVNNGHVHFDVNIPNQIDGQIDGDISGSTIINGTWSEAINQYAGDWDGSTAACSSVALRH